LSFKDRVLGLKFMVLGLAFTVYGLVSKFEVSRARV
jgi:hypothetical protein